jgi:hypothetical protein
MERHGWRTAITTWAECCSGRVLRQAAEIQYRVEHPRWKIWPAVSYEFQADIASLYGEKFLPPLTASPASAFIADGSFVTIYRRSSSETADQ